MLAENLPKSAVEFIPHRPPILMLHELTVCDGDTAEGIAWIPQSSPFHTLGLLPRVFFVELLAQLFAAAQAYRNAGAEASPAGGYLVGVHEFDCRQDARAGDSLNLYVRRTNQVEGLHISEGKVMRGDELLAFGELRCFLDSSAPPLPTAAARHNMDCVGRSGLGEVISGCTEVVFSDAATGRAEADICFVPNAPMFAGHFPQRPIVPGVVWLETAFALTKTLFSQQFRLRRVMSARFKKPISPNDRVRMELDVRSQGGEFLVRSRVNMGNALVTAFDLVLERS